jgi:hypothetical protein
MVRSHTDDDKGTDPPKLTHKVWTVGSIPATDKGFLEWCRLQTKKGATVAMMNLYVHQLNIESIMLHERQQKEQKEQLHLADTAEAISASDSAETFTAAGTDGNPLNIPNPQNIPSPNPQNISSHDNLNIPDLQPQEHSTHPVEPTTSLPPTPSRTGPEQRENQNLNANNLTMNQALDCSNCCNLEGLPMWSKPPQLRHGILR